MSDTNERSVGSAGSVRRRSWVDILVRLRAWRDSPHCRALGYGSFGTKAADDIAEAADEIARLRLTDAERTAIKRLAEDYEQDGEPASAGVVCTLRGLLERLGGER